jgi:broad specificity phosphatase PhoE
MGHLAKRRRAIERASFAWSHWAMIPRRPFYFLRHGQTDWNLEGRYQGHCDTALNRTGVAEAHAAAACLAEVAIGRIVVSPLLRAVATAAIVAERLGKPIQIERGLVERNFGSFNGLVVREVKARHGLRPDQSSRDILPPDADPFHEIFERIPPVVARWLAAHPNELLLFVGHSGVFDALHQHLIGPRSGRESDHAVPYLADPIPSGWELRALRKPSLTRP